MDDLITAYTSAWQRSFDYSGRSNRPAFWWFYLGNVIVLFVLNLLGVKLNLFWWFANLYLLAQIFPSLSITVRRLRDGGKPWPWIFIGLIPIVGGIWLLVLLCQPSLPGLV
jgi:uncharacterized membrane protein YhaH (DUF805 family)